MIEFLALCASLAAIIWTRKKDIQECLVDYASITVLQDSLKDPGRLYRKLLTKFIGYCESVAPRDERAFFFLFFVSIILASIFYLVAWSEADTASIFVQSQAGMADWERKAWLWAVVLGAAFCLITNKFGQTIESSINRSKSGFWALLACRLAAAAVLGAAVFYSTRSAVLASAIGLIAAITAALPQRTYDPQQQLSKGRINFAFAAAFGPVALLSVAFSVVNQNRQMPDDVARTAVLVTVALAAAAFLGAYVGWPAGKGKYDQLPGYAKAPSAMGLHIADGFISFALSVALAVVVSTGLSASHALTPSVGAGVILTCAIFIGGAKETTGAGSGFVLFLTILISSIALVWGNAADIDGNWIETLIFWLGIPIINASFLTYSYLTTLSFLERAKHEGKVILIFTLMDIALTIGLFMAQIVSYIAAIFLISKMSGSSYAPNLSVDFDAALNSLFSSGVNSRVWFYAVLAINLLPTVIHLGIVIVGGISQFLPRDLAKRVSNGLSDLKVPAKRSAHAIDIYSWYLTAFDRVSGAAILVFIFVIAVAAGTYYAGAFIGACEALARFVARERLLLELSIVSLLLVFLAPAHCLYKWVKSRRLFTAEGRASP